MSQLVIPNKLYGRDREIITLLEAFGRISSGHGEVLLVPGSSGAGKTALVEELKAPVRDRNGFFIRGKFDQYRQNIPYFAFRQALAELCGELQSGDIQQLAQFKTDILRAVGNLGQVLVDLVPELEAFLGVQPPLGEISPQEARHRFTEVFRNFLKVICRPEHPLVLFIDDWQWADAASCELLRQMQAGVKLRYLLVIVSYRDNEVDAAHPLMSAVNSLLSNSVSIETLHVMSIAADDVRELISDALKPAAEDVEGLAKIIHGKTLGNPFFVRSFLSFLQEFDLLWFDKAGNRWQWRLDTAKGAELPADIVELFVLKLRRLNSDSWYLFSLAACLGNRFDLETLSLISGRKPGACLELLFSEQAKTLLLPEGPASGDPSEEPGARGTYMFLHDRVQQAAYSLLDPAELPAILLKIGRLLLASLRPEQLAERLFEVVSALNAGSHLIRETEEKLKLVGLNISAARKAYAGTAYRSALHFYRAADRFLENTGFADLLWRDNHDLSMQLFKERAECEFLEGNTPEAEKCIQQAVAYSGTAIEKAAAINILIVHYTLQARYPEAIAAGRQALAALGLGLPEEGYEEARNEEIAQVRQVLASRAISSLIELPVMSQPEMLMASKILITMGPPCYRSHQRLWGVIVPKVVNLTLRYGNIPQVGYSHTAFGGLLGWVDNDYAAAKEFGELATRLMTGTFKSPSDQSVFYLMIGSSIRHWFRHLRAATQDYMDAYEIGLRAGNLQYAAYAFGHNMYCRFYQGVALPALIQESRHSLEFSRSRLNRWAIDLLEGGLNVFGALSGGSDALSLPGRWSEAAYLGRVEENHNIQVACIYKVLNTFSLLVLGDHERALLLSDEAEPLIYTVGTQGLLPWPEHVFARLLLFTALYKKADKKRQAQWRPELDRMLGRLRIWADSCPDNFEHKHLLAAAELARLDGRPVEAMRLYDKAIEAAKAGGFLQWEGMANERAYVFWLEYGNERLAQVYWQEAYVCYSRWGAAAKVSLMEEEYRAYLVDRLSAIDEAGKAAGTSAQGLKKTLLEKQIAQLRNYASQAQQSRLRLEANTQVEELASATERLRAEIAGRKRTEEALRESEERFKALFLEAPLGIALIDSLTGQICEVNPMFARIAGRTMAEMANVDWMSITHPDDVSGDQEQMARLNAGEINGFKMNKRYLRPDGSYVWISMTIAPLTGAKAGSKRHLCMIEDITDHLRLEDRLRQSQKMEAVGVLAGGVAHDFNNILTAIKGYTALVTNTLRPEDSRREDMREIMTSADRAETLTRQLLAFSRKQILSLKVLDLNNTLGDMTKMLQRIIGEDIHLSIKLAAAPCLARVDPGQIEHVIVNLVVNARDAVAKGGEITLETEIQTPPENFFAAHPELPHGRLVCIKVIDTGCGISQEGQKHLFEPFYTTKKQGKGTGLGLSMVYGIVKQSGGDIEVESAPGKGSVFRLFFPLAAAEAPEAAAGKTAEAAQTGTETVLLAEDEEMLRRLGERVLKGLGYTVLVAVDGQDALKVIERHGKPVDLLLTDVVMPGMSGRELGLEFARRKLAGRTLYMSGYTDDAIVKHGVLEPGIAFIYKPFTVDALAAKLREVLDGTVDQAKA